MRYKNVPLRHEIKYYISWQEYKLLQTRLSSFLHPDENMRNPEGYLVRSLYFDDIYDTAMIEKLAGKKRRDKYRVRTYDGSDSFIRLERKSKYDSYISKASLTITRPQLDAMLRGDFHPLLELGTPLAKEVFLRRQTGLLHPAVIVDYLREAYVYRPGNVRITFDKDVRAGVGNDMFSPHLMTHPVVEEGQLVLEVKYDDFLPRTVRRLLGPVTGNISAISKYVMCRERLTQVKSNGMRLLLPGDPKYVADRSESRQAVLVK